MKNTAKWEIVSAFSSVVRGNSINDFLATSPPSPQSYQHVSKSFPARLLPSSALPLSAGAVINPPSGKVLMPGQVRFHLVT